MIIVIIFVVNNNNIMIYIDGERLFRVRCGVKSLRCIILFDFNDSK